MDILLLVSQAVPMLNRIDSVLHGWRWPAFVLFATLSLLATAHVMERLAGLAPCPLCLRQREIHWVAAVMALTALTVWFAIRNRRLLLVLNVMLALVFLAGTVIAAYHAGVEWRFWPAPTGCIAGPATDISAINLHDLNRPQVFVSCDTADWHMLGLSMAGWNALITFALSAVSLRAARVDWPEIFRPDPDHG